MNKSPYYNDLCKGRVALVTGGASGIGYEITKQLGLHGAKVLIMGRRDNYLDNAVKQLNQLDIDVISFCGDVRNIDDVSNAVNKVLSAYGKLDILINSAAGNFLSSSQELSPNSFKTIMDIDALGVYNCSYASYSALKESTMGVIINISATLHYGATWYQTHASAAKAAIDSITRSLALEWGMYNIRVNGIAPGPISDTPGITKLIGDDSELIKKWSNKHVAIQKIGTKFQIAMTALFIIWNQYITGETIVVDGGEWFYTPPNIPIDKVKMISKDIEGKSRGMKPIESKL